MKETFLRVVSVSAPTIGKDDVAYKVVEYQGFMLIGNREAAIKGTVKGTMWPANYERTRDGITTKFRGDAEYDTVQPGDIFAGQIFSCQTTDYRISEDGGWIRNWRGVVFHGKEPLAVAARALQQNQAKPLVEDPETGKMIPFTLPDSGRPVAKSGVKLTDDVKTSADEPA